MEYLVQWKGFKAESDMTWEPEDALEGCADIILDFEKSRKKANRKRPAPIDALSTDVRKKKKAKNVVKKKKKKKATIKK